ncbi:MAG: acyl-CoA dehydrogenase family protein, partial [Pseudomonadales bacterium]
WTVGKRLLQHERSGMESLVSGGAKGDEMSLVADARESLGEREGRIDDPAYRAQLLKYEMDNRVFRLAQRRAVEESEGGTPGPVTSIFKVYGSELQQQFYDLKLKMRGVRGFPDTMAQGNHSFSAREIETTKSWLYYRAASIYSGSNEVQRNIIAKRVLGLPD